mgnify:FL=1
MHSTAKDGKTVVTVSNNGRTATKEVDVTVTGTQYLKRKFASNPTLSFKGNWKDVMPNDTISKIEEYIKTGLAAISITNAYRQLDIEAIIYEEDFFWKNKICGEKPSGGSSYGGCASPRTKIIDMNAYNIDQDYLPTIPENFLHEAAHKLHFYNLGTYRGIPNAPTTPSNFQEEWDVLNIVTPQNTSACQYMPLQNSVTWKDGTTTSPYCVFFRAYGASLLSGDTLFYEDPTTMAESYFKSKTLSDPGHTGKLNLLKKYGFLP